MIDNIEQLDLELNQLRTFISREQGKKDKLLEQLYADIITDPSDVKDSEALQKFKENIKGDKLIE